MKSSNYIFSGLLFSGLAAALGGCNSTMASEEKKNPDIEIPKVETIALEKENFSSTLTIPGELIAYQQVDLYAKVTGFVKQLNVDIGSEVKEGQVLLTLEAPEIVSQLTAAESRLKSQQAVYIASLANYNRLVETSKTPGTISQNDLDIAEAKKNSDLANLDAAKATYKELSEIRNYLVMRAPFSGTITNRNVHPGAYVGPSGKGSELPAFTLQQNKQLRLVFSVPEAYTSYLGTGDTVRFKVRSNPSQVFSARIKRMAGALDARLRSQRIELDIDNKDNGLLAGTVADVNVTLASNGFVVPSSAIVNSSEGVYVVRSVDHKVQLVPVVKGIESNK
ncbi:MAG TPA: efflux RND transporter periplasmic adaptor subunit, partial [Sphingobacteriaceae bacterium]